MTGNNFILPNDLGLPNESLINEAWCRVLLLVRSGELHDVLMCIRFGPAVK